MPFPLFASHVPLSEIRRRVESRNDGHIWL
jgi:hypothetical protein